MGTQQDDLAVVADFIDAFNAIDVDRVMAHFDEGAVYHNMPMAAVSGTEAIRGVIEGFTGLATEIDWQVLHAASPAPGVVLNERVDRFLIQGQWLELPVMGTFELADGKITAWRDYFDLPNFQKRLAEIQGGS